jgi:hypothetical protein
VEECWGPVNSGEDNPPSSIDPANSYFLLKSYTAFDQWGPKFKYHASAYGTLVDIYVDMSAEYPTHRFEIKHPDLSAYKVGQFNAPADNTSVTLSKAIGSTLGFSWQPSPGTELTPKYTVVFYSDAGGANEIGTAPADNDSYAATAAVSHTVLEAAAAAADIPAAGTGDIWWSVLTTVPTQSLIATAAPRKLTVTRLSGIPDAVYITGAASEGGATLGNALAMKKTATGIFEIYTKLTAGNYYFVDGNTGTPQQYSVTGGTTIVEDGTISAAAGIYKIVLNFNTKVAAYSEITQVEFFAAWNQNRVVLTYTSNGVWTGTATPSGWATNDTRYKFKVTSNPGGTKDWVGAGGRDKAPDGSSDFYYIMETSADAQWGNLDGNMWKIPDAWGGWNGNTYKFTFIVSPDGSYTHNVEKQ